MKERTVYIYGLTDVSGHIRYVGQSVNPQVRYEQHLADSTNTPKTRWIRDLSARNIRPGLIILEKTDKLQSDFVEKWWIVLGRKRGWELLNVGKPTSKNPSFGDLFAGQLREDFDQFRLKHDPVIFISRMHIKKTIKAIHILLGMFVGLFIGWHTYLFESTFAPHPLTAICYGIACFVIIAHLNFLWAMGDFKKNARKNLTISAAALVQILTSVVAGSLARY